MANQIFITTSRQPTRAASIFSTGEVDRHPPRLVLGEPFVHGASAQLIIEIEIADLFRRCGQKELDLVIPDPPRHETLPLSFPELDQSQKINEVAN